MNYYVMARESGEFSVQQMRGIAYLAGMNLEACRAWKIKRASEWTISLAC